jgi:hypothetical protein
LTDSYVLRTRSPLRGTVGPIRNPARIARLEEGV